MNIENSKWLQFFESIFHESGNFQTQEYEKYISNHTIRFKDNTTETTVTLIIDEPDLLLNFNIFNPRTPGLNKYEENEYFYKYQFEYGGYGTPGLEYNEINKSVFKEILANGIKGKEIHYYSIKQLYKADLLFEPNKLFFNTTVYFEKRGCFYTLFSKLLEREFKFIRFEIIYDDILILCNSKSKAKRSLN